ncbi:uncharacterized protein LAESUDRAFT_732207 [Laetiporus sulphureus 93-53]|uniref:Uncharacterized protein n=1 Tax=Laetiporus sulphureus 93-53 TaxID=1314785 RepID=A0A165B927_9APHY|nr:uncharacterized protein LAESUDRAFT_732207 [Laetiporus sulphureus 93-53]KZT00526.1 hypothetical protein LAESUDRAFT_732207 [Laetiporus sulphureus 93-53]
MNRLGMSRPEEKARYVSTETDTDMASQPQSDPPPAPSPPAVPSAPPPEPSSTSRPPVSFPASVTAPAAPPSLTPTDAIHMLTALNAQILQTASQLAEACRTVPGFLPPIARTGTLALASPSCAYKPDDYPCPLDMATYAILLQDAAERVHDIAGERMALVLDQMRERVTGLRLVEVRRKGQLTLKVEDLAGAGAGAYKRESEDVRRVHPLDPTLLQLALQTCMVVHCARAIRRWMSGADVWEDREDMLDRLWDRFRETGECECLRSSGIAR